MLILPIYFSKTFIIFELIFNLPKIQWKIITKKSGKLDYFLMKKK
jgi:hypothetical protein